MGTRTLTNEDMLAWFAPEERSRCDACDRDSCVGVDPSGTRICMACGAVWLLDGTRLDVDRRIDAA
jgi:hypothetical protein